MSCSPPSHRELMEADGFTVVHRANRGGRRKEVTRAATYASQGTTVWTPKELDALVAKIEERKRDVGTSSFYSGLCRVLGAVPGALPAAAQTDAKAESEDFGEWPQLQEFVLYGVGRLEDSITAQCQLAFALLLHAWLHLEQPLLVFDPALSALDIAALLSLGVQVMTENEEGLRCVACSTLFYMPHCDLQMYSNVLWANWLSLTQLSRILILGNSFSAYNDACSAQPGAISVISDLLPYVNEHPVPDAFHRVGVFNNTSLHHFRRAPVPAGADVWAARPPRPLPSSAPGESEPPPTRGKPGGT